MAAGLYDITNETLGKGHYGVVKLARHCLTGESVAVKIIDKVKVGKDGLQQIGLEIKMLSRLSEKEHPNIVKLYQVIDTKTKLYLVMEYPGKDVCDLYDYIYWRSNFKGLCEPEARHIFRQICSAIHYCHSLRIVHRDLKPENILIINGRSSKTDHDYEQSSPRVKLIDFGLSNQWDEGVKMRTSCGSLAYSAPEILLGDHYDGDKVDIWGLGCILYILLYGYNPFVQINDSETLTKILDCSFTTPRRQSVCDTSIHLIKSLLQKDPKSRLTIREVLDHAWFRESEHDEHCEAGDEADSPTDNREEDDCVFKNSPPPTSPTLNPVYEVKSPSLVTKKSCIHEKVIQMMVSNGMCPSKDQIEDALAKTRDQVNRTKSSELITCPPTEESTPYPTLNGESQKSTMKSSQDNYVTATYHLLRDKLVRELSTPAAENPTGRGSTIVVSHGRSRRPRKNIVQQAPRFGSIFRGTDRSNNRSTVLEISSSEDDASVVLPLARKCSIVSEEGSCAGTDISGNDFVTDSLPESDQVHQPHPTVDIIVTDYSEPKSMDEIPEGGELSELPERIEIIPEKASNEDLDFVLDELGDTEIKNEDLKRPSLMSNSKINSSQCSNPIHLVSSSPELLRDAKYCDDDFFEPTTIQDDFSSPPSIHHHHYNATGTQILLNDAKCPASDDIGDHIINQLSSYHKSSNNVSSTTTSLRIIVQSKSCNNILLGDREKALYSCPSEADQKSTSRKGFSGNRVTSILKKNKASDKADCCSVC